MPVTKLRRVAVTLVFCSLFCFISDVNGQSVKLYLEEINRLKEEKTTLSIENQTYKHALQLEQEKTAQLQGTVQSIQAGNSERERQIANLNQALAATNSTITFWHRIASSLTALVVLLMMGIAVYWQRDAIYRQFRRVMELRFGYKKSGDNEDRPTVSRTLYEESNIRPEDIFEKLYGRRRAN